MTDDLAGHGAQDSATPTPSQAPSSANSPAPGSPGTARPAGALAGGGPGRARKGSWGQWARDHRALAALAVVAVAELLVIALGAGVTVGRLATGRRDVERALAAQREALQGETTQHTRADNDINALEASLYDSYVVAADLHYRLNEVQNAQRDLEICVPGQGETDRRGWEWRYLFGVVNADLLTLPAPERGMAAVDGLAFSPDGKQLGVARAPSRGRSRSGGTAIVYDAATGADVRGLEDLPTRVGGLLFSPDGAVVAVGAQGGDAGLGLHDAKTGKKLRVLGEALSAPVPLAFSPDGSRLVARSRGGVALLDTKSGDVVASYAGRVAARFSADGKTILIVGRDGRIGIRNATNGEHIRSAGRIASDLEAVVLSPTGSVVAASHESSPGLTVFSVESGQILQRLIGHEGNITALAFSPDGRWLASGGSDRTVRVWDIAAGREVFVFRGHLSGVTSLAYTPGGESLASGDSVGDVRFWDLTRAADKLVASGPTRQGATGWVADEVAFRDGGKHVVALKLPGGRLQTWDAATGVLVADRAVETTTEVMFPGRNVALDPAGNVLAGVSREDRRVLKLWDVASGKPLGEFSPHGSTIRQVDYSADGKRLVTAAWDFAKDPADVRGEVTVWDASTRQPLFELTGPGEQITAVALSANGRLLAVAGFLNARDPGGQATRPRLLFQLWDMSTKQELATFGGHRASVLALTFTPDHTQLVSAGADGVINVWDVRLDESATPAAADGREPLGSVPGMPPAQRNRHVQQFQGPAGLSALAFSSDGKRLAGMTRNQVTIWDTTTAHEVITLRADAGGSDAAFNPRLRFSPAGDRLMTNQADASLALWEAPVPSAESREERLRAASARAYTWHLRQASLSRQGNLTFALEQHLERLKGQKPPSGPVAAMRGQLLMELGRWREAEADLTFAVEHDSDVSGVWAARGLCRAEQQQWDASAADFERALALQADTGAPPTERADIDNNLMKYDEVYTRVTAARPKDTTLLIARSRFDAVHSRWKESAADFAKVPIGSLLGEEGIEYASLLAMLKDSSAYQDLCKRLAEQAGASPGPNQAYVLARAGGMAADSGLKGADLVRWGEESQTSQVARNESLFALGIALYRAGEFAASARRMEETMRVAPGWSGLPMCWPVLALCHERMGHTDEARQWYTRAHDLMARATAGQPPVDILPLPQGIHLADWLEYQTLYREAQGVFGEPSKAN